MCAIMCPKIIYQSICCIVSIHRENSEFVYSLKFYIVTNTSKKLTLLKMDDALRFLIFNAF